MITKNKLPKDNSNKENEEIVLNKEQIKDDNKVVSNEEWWNSVCYLDPHVSEK